MTDTTKPVAVPAAAPVASATPVAASSAPAVAPVASVTLQAKMKEAWNKLSDDDVKLYTTNREQFFGKLKEKHGVTKEDSMQRIQKMEAANAAAADASAPVSSAAAPVVANAAASAAPAAADASGKTDKAA